MTPAVRATRLDRIICPCKSSIEYNTKIRKKKWRVKEPRQARRVERRGRESISRYLSNVWEFEACYIFHVPSSKWCARMDPVEPIYVDAPCERTKQKDPDDPRIGVHTVLLSPSLWLHRDSWLRAIWNEKKKKLAWKQIMRTFSYRATLSVRRRSTSLWSNAICCCCSRFWASSSWLRCLLCINK